SYEIGEGERPKGEGLMQARRARHRHGVVGLAIAIAAAAMLVPALAFGHIERASYWPNPAPDTSVKPPAGGSVPAIRNLYSALDQKKPGKTRVVCQQVPSKQLRKHATSKHLSNNKSTNDLNKTVKPAHQN